MPPIGLGASLGIGAGRSATSSGSGAPGGVLETFPAATLRNGSNLPSNSNLFTFTAQPSAAIVAGSIVTLAGLTGSVTGNNGSLTVGGAAAAIFGSSGSWTQSTGTLVLTVDTGQTIPIGSDTTATFTLTNPSGTNAGVTSATLSSSGYTSAAITGKFLDTAANKFNIDIRDTRAGIRARTGDAIGLIAFVTTGAGQYDIMVYDGANWQVYEN